MEDARDAIAASLECRARRVVFTSGATEAARLAINSLVAGAGPKQRRVLRSPVEHPAVAGPVDALRDRGYAVEEIPLDAQGALDRERFDAMLGDDLAFAAVTLVNHDTGVIYGDSLVAEQLASRGIAHLCDAALAPGRCGELPRRSAYGVTLLSGAKVGALPGSGAMILDGDVAMKPVARSGVQEEGLRPGSYGVVALASFAAALPVAVYRPHEERHRIDQQFRELTQTLQEGCGATLLGDALTRGVGVGTFHIPGCLGESLLMHMDLAGIAMSTGSRCALGGNDVSPTLLAMGLANDAALQTIRISMGTTLTRKDLSRVTSTLFQGVSRIRSWGPKAHYRS